MNLIKQSAKVAVMNPVTSYALGTFILILLAAYMYFANAAVRTLTRLESTKEDKQSLSVEVSELESTHLALESGISTALAKSLGLSEVSNTTFIVKNSSHKTLSFNKGDN